MSKIAMIALAGHFGGACIRMMEEGHNVGLYVKDRFWKPRLDGMVEKLHSLDDVESWKPDVVVFEYTGLDKEFDRLSALFPTFNGNKSITKLETDRKYGLEVMHENGIAIPRTVVCPNLGEAIKFLQDKENCNERWVFKQDVSDVSNLTIVEKECGSLILDIERLIKTKILTKSTPCILQMFIEGDEIDFEAWVQNGRIIRPLNVTIEHKKAFAGDLGSATGASSAVVWSDDPYSPSEIARSGILKLEKWLINTGYNGQLSLNSIVKDGKVYGLEFTCRPGINASFLLIPLISGGLGDTLIKGAKGELAELPLRQGMVSAGITFSTYPYPLDLKDTDLQGKVMKETAMGVCVCDMDSPLLKDKGIFWGDVHAHDGDVHCPGTDALLAFNARLGRTVSEATEKALSDKELFSHIPSLQYRADGVPRAHKTIESLYAQGMLKVAPL